MGRFIRPWVDLLAGVHEQVLSQPPDLRQRALEHLAVQRSLDNLKSFAFVSTAIDQGLLELHGAWFSIAEGALEWLDRTTGTFEPVAP